MIRTVQLTAPSLAALAALGLAALAWLGVIAQNSSMDPAMGLGPVGPFMVAWLVMMAAMMLPSAVPFVVGFVRLASATATWPVASFVLIGVYLTVWSGFGIIGYFVFNGLRMPWPAQSMVAGLTVAGAGLYSLTPLHRGALARCRALCEQPSIDRNRVIPAAAAHGITYGINCIGCSAALMVAMLLIGMSNLAWMAVGSVLVLLYKVAPRLDARSEFAIAAFLVVSGEVYVATQVGG